MILLPLLAAAAIDWGAVAAVRIGTNEVAAIDLPGVGRVWQRPAPPPYDAECDWVEAAGEQWVDTLCAVTADTRIEATWRQTSTAIQQRLFGVNDGGGAAYACYLNNNGVWAVNTGTSSGGAIGSAVQTGVDYAGSFDLASGKCTINGTVRSNGGTPFDSANTIPVFARRNTGTVQLTYLAEMRLMSFRIYQGGTLVRDFAPVRVGQTGSLYDRVSGTLFYSATSTPLVAGPDRTP